MDNIELESDSDEDIKIITEYPAPNSPVPFPGGGTQKSGCKARNLHYACPCRRETKSRTSLAKGVLCKIVSESWPLSLGSVSLGCSPWIWPVWPSKENDPICSFLLSFFCTKKENLPTEKTRMKENKSV